MVKTSLSLSDPFVVQVFGYNLRKVIGDGIDLLFCNSDDAKSFTNSHRAVCMARLVRLMLYSGNLHVAEVVGEDGEGLLLGTGLPLDCIKFLDNKDMKVIAAW